MKKFNQYLTEQNVSYDDALKILGLQGGFSADELKTAYKKAAIANHPDKGGSVVMMQKVNGAHDTLKRAVGTGGGRQNYADWKAKRKEDDRKDVEFLKAVVEKVKSRMNPTTFVKHFEKIFGESFTHEVHEMIGGVYSSHARVTMRFSNKEHTTVLDLDITVWATERHKGGLASDSENNVTITVAPEILHNRQKIKLTKRDWGTQESDYAVLADPEKVFPTSKLMSKKDKVGKFSKKDAYLIFEKELKASYSGDDVKIPLPKIGPKAYINMYRLVFMRQASWAFRGISNRETTVANQGYVPLAYGYIEEKRASIGWLVDNLKQIQKLDDIMEIKAKVDELLAKYKTNHETIDPETKST